MLERKRDDRRRRREDEGEKRGGREGRRRRVVGMTIKLMARSTYPDLLDPTADPFRPEVKQVGPDRVGTSLG
jgi:hypothetical protein